MPADESLIPVIRNGSGPYQCSQFAEVPRADWSHDYGYCRTSLDHQPPNYRQGSAEQGGVMWLT